jgi:hypothetical protein
MKPKTLTRLFNVGIIAVTVGVTMGVVEHAVPTLGEGVQPPEAGDAFFEGGTNDSGLPEATTCSPQSQSQCAPDGGPGCAGDPGTGGAGGQGGGGSIALYIGGNSHVTISGGGFFVGPGGWGGNGGNGGLGNPGNPGFGGGDFYCPSGCSASCTPEAGFLEAGTPGAGGRGGSGGQGGGGAGGPQYFYVYVSPSPAPNLLTQSFTLQNSAFNGTPGIGGQPNGPNGPDAGVTP